VSKWYKITNEQEWHGSNPNHKRFHLPHGHVDEFRFLRCSLFGALFVFVREGTVQQSTKEHSKCKTTQDSEQDSPAVVGQDELIKRAHCQRADATSSYNYTVSKSETLSEVLTCWRIGKHNKYNKSRRNLNAIQLSASAKQLWDIKQLAFTDTRYPARRRALISPGTKLPLNWE